LLEKYIRPHLRAGRRKFSVRVRDVLGDLAREDFPSGRTPLVCAVLQGKKFTREAGLEVESVDGPPSKQSPTVVVHYRVIDRDQSMGSKKSLKRETPAERAFRLTEKLRGLMKDEIAAHGGTEGYMRWVRSDDEEAA
jgi:hypothetical protein